MVNMKVRRLISPFFFYPVITLYMNNTKLTINMAKKLTRQEANRKLVKVINDLVEAYPDWRFGQILFNAQFIIRKKDSLDIQDPFYEESTETWGRIKSIINIPEESEGE